MSRLFFAAALLWALPAGAVDWAKIPGKDMTLFYPAQLSWESLLTQDDHSGAQKFRDGKDCRQCHEGEEAASGTLLIDYKKTEPTPIAGKPGSVVATVKAARDAERLYIRLEFDPGKQPDAGQEPNYPIKVALMFDDGHVPEVKRAGCWAACHDDSAKMASGAAATTTKYLARTRAKMSRTGGGDLKPAEDLAKLKGEGGFLEYWQARLNATGLANVVDGTVFDKREEHTASVVTAEATQVNGKWAVTFSRKLTAGAGYKDFVPGKTYTLGFSIHAGHTAQRFHYVSLEKTLTLDQGPADLVAAAQ